MIDVVLVHGGVDMSDDEPSLSTLRQASAYGWRDIGDPLEAVASAIEVLEDDPAFNAGYGSVLNEDGDVEVDAAVVDGLSGRFGAVGAVPGLRHPSRVATHILRGGRSALVSGAGARRLADELGEPFENLRTAEQRLVWAAFRDGGSTSPFTGRVVPPSTETVGCLAVRAGHIIAGSSTGGLCRKRPGRIGDSAILGAGLWADRRVGVLCSGSGEAMMALQLARRTAERIHDGSMAAEAVRWAVEHASELLSATCAVVAIDIQEAGVAAAHNGASFPVVVVDAASNWVVEAERLEEVPR